MQQGCIELRFPKDGSDFVVNVILWNYFGIGTAEVFVAIKDVLIYPVARFMPIVEEAIIEYEVVKY